MPTQHNTTRHDTTQDMWRVQLVEGAEAKAAFGLVQNWESLKAVTQALMECESISGDRLREIMVQNDALVFPDPYVAGFGWDEEGEVIYPGSAVAGTTKVGALCVCGCVCVSKSTRLGRAPPASPVTSFIDSGRVTDVAIDTKGVELGANRAGGWDWRKQPSLGA